MTARIARPLGLRPDGGVAGKATCRPAGPDAVAALIRAAHAVTRQEAALHLFDAVKHGLPADDAQQALKAWDAANPIQQIRSQS